MNVTEWGWLGWIWAGASVLGAVMLAYFVGHTRGWKESADIFCDGCVHRVEEK